jgi:hypothetical protein
MEQRSRFKTRHHRNRRLVRRVLQQIRQVGLIQRMAIDREADGRLVVAETLQCLLEPPDIAARPGYQRERANRRLLAQ